MPLLSLTQKTKYNETIHIRNHRNICHGILRLAILEFLLTFFLMMVIIKVSKGSKDIGTMAGIAVAGVI
jgi:glycerol uptake facilitator-like aquaporin